jgi:hypothetical protein
MMYARGFLSGAGPYVKRYMAGTTMGTAGIPLLGAIAATTDLGSVEPMAASTAVTEGSMVGLLMSTTGTISDTGMTNDDIFVEVLVNPDLVYGARANNGTTSGTALTPVVATVADTTGAAATVLTTIDDGALIGVTGGNVGEMRRCDDTAGSVSINFPNAIAIDDTFITICGFPCGVIGTNFISYDLTTDLTEVVATTAVTDMDNFATLDIKFDVTDPTNRTEYQLVANNHLFGSSTIS